LKPLNVCVEQNKEVVMSATTEMDFVKMTEQDKVAMLTLEEKVERAIALFRQHEPEEGYYLAFSGGKDSCVIKELAIRAGVKFEAVYNHTTVDAPELMQFMRKHHKDVTWNRMQKQPMLKMVAEANKVPPTRFGRWCCERYKEGGGEGRLRVIGVRAAESRNRSRNWQEYVSKSGIGAMSGEYICPIVYWSDQDVWDFLLNEKVPYCTLYDEGFTRLGCVGCPLAGPSGQDREFERWPAFERAWKKAVIANWEKWHDVPNKKGEVRYQGKFKTGEDFWKWWRYKELPDYENCQMELMWTN
jgi:phosphoadenosine phosphosulfate reductase